MRCGMRKRLRLMLCVLRTVRNDAHPRTFRTLADLDYRDTQRLDCRDAPPLECSHELPMFVRGHMRMGMCVYARVRRKYIFILSNKVETD
jgi:hypothetical protein